MRPSTGSARRLAATLVLVLVASSLASCGATRFIPGLQGKTLTLMTFNVENLFDAVDDPGKADETYLPLAAKQNASHAALCEPLENDYWREQCLYWDWSEAVVEKKLTAVAGAILAAGNGRGPDLVILQEVENIRILERLRNDFLADAEYLPAVLVEGTDRRGIDVAFLSRLPLVGKPKLHKIPFEGFSRSEIDDTRGILEATFRLPDGALMTGFAVHFPAPFHPYAMREQAYEFLNLLKDDLPDDRLVFAAGDFNTTSAEVLQQSMLERYVRGRWVVAHEQGCKGCRGTQYYSPADSWSFLDMILWGKPASRDEEPRWQLAPGSVRIANEAPGQTTADGTPARFRLPEGSGVSDHWPLAVDIRARRTGILP